jgi:redox-sensitive bicupin YhaK (pirin superfamily)
MMKLRRADERGHANHGWLDTHHTFSFAQYYDKNHMGFRSLRVLNDDRVQPGQGFGSHPHRDMEIITYVLEGVLAHKDSTGGGSVIRPGDVQRMSAGSGVIHSEFNHSDTEPVHFLQIWIEPDTPGIEPGYEQKSFTDEDKRGRLRLIASPDARDGSLTIRQDALVYATVLGKGDEVGVDLAAGRHAWVHVARGTVTVNGELLSGGDGAAVSEESRLTLVGVDGAEVLVFDLA